MSAQAILTQPSIDLTLKQILSSEKITLNEQRWLISLSFGGSLNRQEAHLVNKVYEALWNGLLVIVDG